MSSNWHGPKRLDGQAKEIAVGRNEDGRLEIFFRGTGNHLYRNWQLSPGTQTSWSGPTAFVGDSAAKIAVMRNTDQRLELFYIGENGQLYRNRQSAANSSHTYDGETSFGINPAFQVTDFVVGAQADGRITLIFLADNGGGRYNLGQIIQTAPSSTTWSISLISETQDAEFAPLALSSNPDRRLTMMGKGLSGQIRQMMQSAPNGSAWVDVGSSAPPGNVTQLVMEHNADGQLEIFYLDGSTLFHDRQAGVNSGAWAGQTEFPGVKAKQVAVARNKSGALEIFYRGMGDHLYHDWQLGPNSSGWNGSTAFPGVLATGIALGQNLDGRLELFYPGEGSDIYHDWQLQPG